MNNSVGVVKMIESTGKVLDENDQDLIEALEAIGVRRNVATIIVYLKDLDEATSRDIEKGSGLRQSEVSIAMNKLRERGWIAERDIKRQGKGRPMKMYRLTVPIDDIIEHYEEVRRSESARAIETIQRLKQISAT
jgi:predicted transcriptional regulator